MDRAMAADGLGVSVGAGLADVVRGTTLWRVDRWDAEQAAWAARRIGFEPVAADFRQLDVRPYGTSEVMGNLITNAGWTRLMSLLVGTGATQIMDAGHTRIGVGDNTTTEQYTDAALGATTNKLYKMVSSGPTLGTRTLTFGASFASGEANWAWGEFGLDIGATADSTTVAAVFFNHKAGIAQGTKASGQVWSATSTLTFT